eukprot:7512307-Alexandrium_andersonii.AAC.1
MSASLVGSEMCIRDRSTGWSARASASSFGGSPTSSATPSISSGPTASVSYTHLTLPTICSV